MRNLAWSGLAHGHFRLQSESVGDYEQAPCDRVGRRQEACCLFSF